MTIIMRCTPEELALLQKGAMLTLSEPLKDIVVKVGDRAGYEEIVTCEVMQVAVDPLKGKSLFLNVRGIPW